MPRNDFTIHFKVSIDDALYDIAKRILEALTGNATAALQRVIDEQTEKLKGSASRLSAVVEEGK